MEKTRFADSGSGVTRSIIKEDPGFISHSWFNTQ